MLRIFRQDPSTHSSAKGEKRERDLGVEIGRLKSPQKLAGLKEAHPGDSHLGL